MKYIFKKTISCLIILSFVLTNTAYSSDTITCNLRPVASAAAEETGEGITYDLNRQTAAIRIDDEPFDKQVHRERINLAFKELLDTPDTNAFSPYSAHTAELYHVRYDPDDNIKKNVVDLLKDKSFNLIVVDGMRKTLKQYGATTDIIFHAGRGKNHKSRNIYIDKIDYDLLVELDAAFPVAQEMNKRKVGYGSYLLANAIRHEIAHMDNPQWDEKKVASYAPSAQIIEVFKFAKLIDNIVFDNNSYSMEGFLNQLNKFLVIPGQLLDYKAAIEIIKIRAELLFKRISNNNDMKLKVKGMIWDLLTEFYINDRQWFNLETKRIEKLKKGFMDGMLDVVEDDPLGIETLKNIFIWFGREYNDPDYGDARDYILKFVESGEKEDWQELKGAFYKKSEFGTAGRRSLMFSEHSLERLGNLNGEPICMPGPNRLNIWTVRETALMVGKYLLQNQDNPQVVNPKNPKLVYIGYDVRYNSRVFAHEIAKVMYKLGFDVRLFDRSVSISALAWAVKRNDATIGFEITASHNPKGYNGIKVEGKDGGQISSTYAAGIINEVGYPSLSELKGIGKLKNIEKFVNMINAQSFDREYIGYLSREGRFVNDLTLIRNSGMRVMIDPLSGTGIHTIERILLQAGVGEENIVLVSEHNKEDSAFAGLSRPDPANRQAVSLAISKAIEYEAKNPDKPMDAILLTDPDNDRLACIAKNLDGNWEILSANRLWSLIAWAEARMHIDRNHVDIPKKNWAGLVKSGVTTKMLDLIAKKYNYDLKVTPTGFALVGPEMMKFDHSFGFEDSYGMGMSGHIPEKDATLAALKTAEVIAYAKSQKLSLYELLIEMYMDIGYYVSNLPTSYIESDKNFDDTPEGYQAIRKANKNIANNPPLKVGKIELDKTRVSEEDKLAAIFKGMRIPYGQSLAISVRPSGTEPKNKIYPENIVKLEIDEGLPQKACQRIIYDIMKNEDAYLYSIIRQFKAELFTDEIVSNGGLMFDVDGNLAPRDGAIPQTSIDMLIYLMSRGVRTAINSGHSFDESVGELALLHSLGIKERVIDGIDARFRELLVMRNSKDQNEVVYSRMILDDAHSLYDIYQNLIIYSNNSTQKYLFDRVSGSFREDLSWQKGFINPKDKVIILNGIKIILSEIRNDPKAPEAVKLLVQSDVPIVIDRQSRVTFAFNSLKENSDSVILRSYIAKKLNEYLKLQDIPVEVSISGATTIGINRIDVEKDTALRDFISTQNLSVESVVYIGDEFYPEGNDLPVLKLKGITAINTDASKAQPAQAVNLNGKVDAVEQILLMLADIHSHNLEDSIDTPFTAPAIAGFKSMHFKNTGEPVDFSKWEFIPRSMGEILISKEDKETIAYSSPEGFIISAGKASSAGSIFSRWRKDSTEDNRIKELIIQKLGEPPYNVIITRKNIEQAREFLKTDSDFDIYKWEGRKGSTKVTYIEVIKKGLFKPYRHTSFRSASAGHACQQHMKNIRTHQQVLTAA
jgi:phosphoglucomutase